MTMTTSGQNVRGASLANSAPGQSIRNRSLAILCSPPKCRSRSCYAERRSDTRPGWTRVREVRDSGEDLGRYRDATGQPTRPDSRSGDEELV